MKTIKTVGVCGAGTMGSGIAQVFAQNGFSVVLFELNETVLQQAQKSIEKNLSIAVEKGKLTEAEKQKTLSGITFTIDLNQVKADLIIEAIIENLAIKQKLFADLAAINTPETILASNTSSLAITAIAKGINHPGRVVGLHFFNPAHLMKLVEVIKGVSTDEETIETLKALSITIGKTPVLCQDSPGFIVNRVARHYYVESLKILEENACKMQNIDELLESTGFKMGPFKLMDTIGNDINFAVTSSMYQAFHQEAKFRPSRIQQQKVDAGYLGKKTGKGFYDYNA
ncbi:MAG: 3-hydroxyacyl-CoA dehydrogenase NAD-binding domain-containing protein [Chitinophagales bacterium]